MEIKVNGEKMMMMRRRGREELVVEFRTPQHPCVGTNNWGGASPLLARDIPKESLEQRYLKLNTIRTRDEVFPADDHGLIYFPDHHHHHQTTIPPPTIATGKPSAWPPGRDRGRKGLFSKLLIMRRRGVLVLHKQNAAPAPAVVVLGGGAKQKRWFPRWDPAHRWPQGWC